MSRAGFSLIPSSRIAFGRDGRWYADGEPILNQRIARLFSRHVCRHPEGGYQIVVGDEHARIEVEDTPFVIVAVTDNPGDGFSVVLNDGSEEPLDLRSFTVGPGDVPSCAVKGGAERARFLRAAYYQIAPFIEGEGGDFYLRCGGSRHRIVRA